MDNQKKCPQCGEMIDADSRYCDQCGAMMYLCPEHLIFGKGQGKRCGQCGKELVAADQLDKQQPQGPVQQPVEPAQPELPRTGTYTPPAMPVDLYCAAMHITIPLIQGAVIGRTTGNYVGQLGQCIYISGTHASLGQDAAGWTITDLGSRNGTKVNGVACVPHQPARINVGNIVRIANFYDFVVR